MKIKYPKFNESQDARRKIPTSEHSRIKKMCKIMTRQEVADKYGVSLSLIKTIISPTRIDNMRRYQKENKVWLLYYNKEKHTLAIRKHRRRKNRFQRVEYSAFRKYYRKKLKAKNYAS